MSLKSQILPILHSWFGLKPVIALVIKGVLRLWVKAKILPDDLSELEIDITTPLCYVLDLDGLSNRLILENVCSDLSLPEPDSTLLPGDDKLPSLIYLRRLRGFMVRRADPRISEDLKNLLTAYEAGQIDNIQFVPVSILWGRAPQKENSILKLLFSDSWSIAGRLRKFMIILIHGRNMFVRFNRPVYLDELYNTENKSQTQNALMDRKLSRILRVHFRRVKEAAIGPDLSHRRVMVDSLLETPSVRRAIAHQVHENAEPTEKVRERARKYANEIAADYSHPFIRMMEAILRWLWNSLYDGVQHRYLSEVREAASGRQIVYVPCHRSHIDYMLLSYVLYTEGLVPPHIAAGINLNLPIIGPFLRRGGAFFIRRSFRGQPLYAAVFDSYLRSNLSKGIAIEYFIEGTRSRTGKLLDPKGGMLAMTVKSYLKDQTLPIIFVPVYFGYERLIEGRSYEKELGGQAKKKETIWGLIKSLGILRRNFGHVYVNFGQPIHLADVLDRHAQDWRTARESSDQLMVQLNSNVTNQVTGEATGQATHEVTKIEIKSATKLDRLARRVVPELGQMIQIEINRNAAISPVNLIGLVIQATENQALALTDLENQIELYVHLLKVLPYSERITMDARIIREPVGSSVVQYGLDFGLLVRRTHSLGDVIELHASQGRLLSYYRNNVKHLLTLPSLVACVFMANRTLNQNTVVDFTAAMYALARGEYFLQWDTREIKQPIQEAIDELVGGGLLTADARGSNLTRPKSDSMELRQLALLANVFFETLERYNMILQLVLSEPSTSLSQADLEQNCRTAAEHRSLLEESTSPEYFDGRAFKRVMTSLLGSGNVWKDDERKLCYGDKLRDMGTLLAIASDIPTEHRPIHHRSLQHDARRLATTADKDS